MHIGELCAGNGVCQDPVQNGFKTNTSFITGDFEKTNSAKLNILLMLSISDMCKNAEITTIYATKGCPICSLCRNPALRGLHTRPLGPAGRVN